MTFVYKTILVALALALTACGQFDSTTIDLLNEQAQSSESTPAEEILPGNDEVVDEPSEIVWPQFNWDNRHEDYITWNKITYEAIETFGVSLTSVVPDDVNRFCPNFNSLDEEEVKMFWISLIATMARYESNHKPNTFFQEGFKDANGEFIISRGLLQLSIESGRGYGCPIEVAEDLHDPQVNLECGVRIIDRWVGRDGVISDRVNGKWLGGARYWSVLRTPSTLAKIIDVTSNSDLCN